MNKNIAAAAAIIVAAAAVWAIAVTVIATTAVAGEVTLAGYIASAVALVVTPALVAYSTTFSYR